MNLIAIESSTETLSLAVQGRGVLAQRDIQGGAAASRTLLPLLRELLMQAGVAPKDLNAVVFGQGPGSFTGIRTACAVAQGFAYGLGLPVLPVGTLWAVAQGAREAGVVEVLEGLKVGDRVALSPPDTVQDGQKVAVIEPKPAKG